MMVFIARSKLTLKNSLYILKYSLILMKSHVNHIDWHIESISNSLNYYICKTL